MEGFNNENLSDFFDLVISQKKESNKKPPISAEDTSLNDLFASVSEEKKKEKKKRKEIIGDVSLDDLFSSLSEEKKKLKETEIEKKQEIEQLEKEAKAFESFLYSESTKEKEKLEEKPPKPKKSKKKNSKKDVIVSKIEEKEEIQEKVDQNIQKSLDILDKLKRNDTDIENEEDPALRKLKLEVEQLRKLVESSIRTATAQGGGGEVRLEFLDDVDRNSAKTDGYFLQYQASTGKFVGAAVTGGGGGVVGSAGTWAVDSVGINTVKNVGIGTTAKDGYKLYVEGDARVTGILTVGPASVTIDGINNRVTSESFVGNLTGSASSVGGVSSSFLLDYNNFNNTPTIPDTSTLMPKSGGTFTGSVTINGGNYLQLKDSTNIIGHNGVINLFRFTDNTRISGDTMFFTTYNGVEYMRLSTAFGTQLKHQGITKLTVDSTGINVNGQLNDLTIPSGTGTIAITDDIPTNNNELTNGAGYITSSGSITGTAAGLSGNPDISVGSITATSAEFSGNVTIGGTLTYEDVDNIDSIGLITARSGINVTGGQISVGAAFSVGQAGIVTASGFVGNLTGSASSVGGVSSSFLLDYNNFNNTPTIPSDTGDLTNNAGFVTSGIVVGYATEGYVDTQVGLATVGLASEEFVGLATVGLASEEFVGLATAGLASETYVDTQVGLATAGLASETYVGLATVGLASETYVNNLVAISTFSGDYNDLTNQPTIPSDTGDLTNGAGFVTFTNTNQLTNGAGFITASDNITGTAAGISGTPNIVVGITTVQRLSGFKSLVGSASSTTETFVTTVDSKTTNHRYHGSGSSSAYFLDGVESPFLTLLPGKTYRFDQSDSSNSGHPLRFYLEADKTTAYTTNVTTNGTAGASGAYTEILVTDSTPLVLHYQCSSHGYMGNSSFLNSNLVDTPYQITARSGINVTGVSTFQDNVNVTGNLVVDTNTLLVNSTTNRIGIGTTNPAYQVEIENTGANALLVLDRTDGAACFIEGQETRSAFGSVNETPIALAYNSFAVVTIGAGGSIRVNPDGDGYTFPTTDGSANQVLRTDGEGNLSFATVSSGGINNVVDDTTPQLGGNLDLNSHDINGTGNIDITGTLNVSGVSTFSGDANFQNVSVGGTLSLSGDGSQFFAYNEDTVKVKFANWYSSNDRQYGMGQLWFETWFAAIDDNPSQSLRDERRIGFYLEKPNNGSSDSGGTSNIHPTNDRMHIDINGVFVRDNFEVTGVSTFTDDITANGNIVGDDSTNISGINSVTATNFFGTTQGQVSYITATETLTNKTLRNPIFESGANSPEFLETRFVNATQQNFVQLYTGGASGSYFTQGEYQKIATITPSGDFQNYTFNIRLTATSASNYQIVNFTGGLRANTLPDLDFTVNYSEEHNGVRFIEPKLWTKETTTAGFILAFEYVHSSSLFGGVNVEATIIPRSSAQRANVAFNTTQDSEQTSIDTGFTENDPTLTLSTVNGVPIFGTEFKIEGSTDNDFETTITSVDATADRTITFPDSSGTVALTGNVLENVADDTSPQLGGNLDLNSKDITGNGSVNISGIVTANAFIGDGTGLTGVGGGSVISGITIREEGSTVGTAGTVVSVNFVGDNITATASGAGATITVSATPTFDSVSVGVATASSAFYMPQYTTTARDAASFNEGAMIYNTTTKKMEFYDGTSWISLPGMTLGLTVALDG